MADIPGRLDWRALADPRDAHRPTDPELLRAEIRRLHRNGLTANDISEALRISLVTVLEAMGNESP